MPFERSKMRPTRGTLIPHENGPTEPHPRCIPYTSEPHACQSFGNFNTITRPCHPSRRRQRHSIRVFPRGMFEGLSTYLSEEVTKGPSDEGGAGLGREGVLVELLVVRGPSRDGASTDGGGIAEEGRGFGGTGLVLAEGGDESGLGEGRGGRAGLDRAGVLDTEGRGRKKHRGEEDGVEELHLCFWGSWG